MPEITVIHIAALFVALLIGIVLGWFARGGRSRSEKAAINAGWQEQLHAQRNEHERLLDQQRCEEGCDVNDGDLGHAGWS